MVAFFFTLLFQRLLFELSELVNELGNEQVQDKEVAQDDDYEEENNGETVLICRVVSVHHVDPTLHSYYLSNGEEALKHVIEARYAIQEHIAINDVVDD